MRRIFVIPAVLCVLTVAALVEGANAAASDNSQVATTGWQTPAEDIMKVLHAPQLPWVWTSPTGEYLGLVDPVLYPPLAELAAPMHKLAGMRVNPATNGYHGRHGGTSPRLVRVEDGTTTSLALPENAEIHDVA